MSHPHHLICPHCRVALRVRDRTWRGRVISCPDCHQPIEIELTGHDEWVGRPVAEPKPSRQSTTPRRWLTPPRIGWGVAGLLLILLMTLFSRTDDVDSDASPINNHSITVASVDVPKNILPEDQSDALAQAEAAVADETNLVEPTDIASQAGPLPIGSIAEKPQTVVARKPATTDVAAPTIPGSSAPQQPNNVPEATDDQPLNPDEQEVLQQDVPKVWSNAEIEQSLRQPIKHFQQRRPIKVEEMLSLLNEMAGVPIIVADTPDAKIDSHLKQTVTVDLQNTDVRSVLEHVLSSPPE